MELHHNFIFRYTDDLSDRKECDCLNDCEMVHFFSTMQREPFSQHTEEWRPQRYDHFCDNCYNSDILFLLGGLMEAKG